MTQARDGSYRCFHCGATLDVAADSSVRVVFTSRSGRASECVLRLDGREIHRCPLHGPWDINDASEGRSDDRG
jgi:hypothetical protein